MLLILGFLFEFLINELHRGVSLLPLIRLWKAWVRAVPWCQRAEPDSLTHWLSGLSYICSSSLQPWDWVWARARAWFVFLVFVFFPQQKAELGQSVCELAKVSMSQALNRLELNKPKRDLDSSVNGANLALDLISSRDESKPKHNWVERTRLVDNPAIYLIWKVRLWTSRASVCARSVPGSIPELWTENTNRIVLARVYFIWGGNGSNLGWTHTSNPARVRFNEPFILFVLWLNTN